MIIKHVLASFALLLSAITATAQETIVHLEPTEARAFCAERFSDSLLQMRCVWLLKEGVSDAKLAALAANVQVRDHITMAVTNATVGTEFTPALPEPVEGWTFDTKVTSRHTFSLFGSVASQQPVSTSKLGGTIGRLDILLIAAVPVAKQNPGALATYGDIIISRTWGLVTVGAEMFHAPPQYNAPNLTAFVPQITLSDEFHGRTWSLGWQWVVPMMEYDGEHSYLWGDLEVVKLSRGLYSFVISPGFVLGDTGRRTLYFNTSINKELRDSVEVYVTGIWARSEMPDGSYADIPFTPGIGMKYGF